MVSVFSSNLQLYQEFLDRNNIWENQINLMYMSNSNVNMAIVEKSLMTEAITINMSKKYIQRVGLNDNVEQNQEETSSNSFRSASPYPPGFINRKYFLGPKKQI